MDIPLQASHAELQEQVIRLTQDKRELTDYAERVTKELRRYQQARPQPPARPEDDAPLPPWATNMQMMSPLLFAYEERIAELEAVIERSVGLAEQAGVLTKENDGLRAQLHERTQQLRNTQILAPARETTKEVCSADTEELQDLYRLSVEQNEALAQQNQLLKLQIERMQQSIVVGQQQLRDMHAKAVEGSKAFSAEQERTARAFGVEKEQLALSMAAEQERWAQALTAEKERVKAEQDNLKSEQESWAKAVLAEKERTKAEHERTNVEKERAAQALAAEKDRAKAEQERWNSALASEQDRVRSEQEGWATALADEKQRAETLVKQRGIAEQRVEAITAELAEQARTRERLDAELEKMKNDLELHRQSAELFRKSIDGRTAMDQQELERLRANLDRTSRLERDQRQRLLALESKILEADESRVMSCRDADTAKHEHKQLLAVVVSMERRLKDSTEQQDHARARLHSEETQVADLLTERSYWSMAEQAASRQAERFEGKLQNELHAMKNLVPSHELDSLRLSHSRLMSETEDRLRRSEQCMVDLKAQVELFERQKTWESSAVDRLKATHGVEREQHRSDLEETQVVRLRLERQADHLRQELGQLRTELDDAAVSSREQLQKAGVELSSCRSKCQGVERQLGQAREEILVSEGAAANASSERARVQDELKAERVRLLDELESQRRRALTDQRSLEWQLQHIQAKAHQDERRAVELLKAQESLRLRWQAELGLEKDSLEMQVEKLTKENRAMRERSRGVLKALAANRAFGEDAAKLPATTALGWPSATFG